MKFAQLFNRFWMQHPDINEVECDLAKVAEGVFAGTFKFNGQPPSQCDSKVIRESANDPDDQYLMAMFRENFSSLLQAGWELLETRAVPFAAGHFILKRIGTSLPEDLRHASIEESASTTLADMLSNMGGTAGAARRGLLNEISAGGDAWRYEGVNRYYGHGQCLVALVDGSEFAYYRPAGKFQGGIDALNDKVGRIAAQSGHKAAYEHVRDLMSQGLVTAVGTEYASDTLRPGGGGLW